MPSVRMFVAGALAALGLSLVVPGQPAAASCAQQTPAEQAARADVIVFGTVTSIRMTLAPASPVIVFRPERVLKGTLTKSVQVYLGPTRGGAVTSVDYAAASPQRHTLYLRDAHDGSFETDACSGSHEGPPTAAEEKLLGAGTPVDAAADGGDVGPPVAAAVLALVAAALVVGLAVRWRVAGARCAVPAR